MAGQGRQGTRDRYAARGQGPRELRADLVLRPGSSPEEESAIEERPKDVPLTPRP
ncbi:MAG: hypothetical protein ACR2LY_02300 [Thermoleophilaceae bacterium]